MTLCLMLALNAAAGEPVTLEHAQYLSDRGERQRAAAAVSEILTDDPDNLHAHALYISVRSGQYRTRDQLVPMYRAWHAEEPTVAASYGLALAISTIERELDAASCDEVDELLADVGGDADYLKQRVLLRSVKDCERDVASIHDAIRALDTPEAWAWTVHRAAIDNKDVTADIARLVQEKPQNLGPLASVVFKRNDRAAKANQKALLAAVEPLAAGDDLRHLHAANRVYASAKHKGLAQTTERLDALDPRLEKREPRPPTDKLMTDIYEANKRPSHELALEDLDRLAKKIPESGEIRSAWQSLRHQRLVALDRPDEAYEALKDGARAVPDDGSAANGWAYEAANRGVDLEEALAAIDKALAERDAPLYKPTSYYTFEQFADGERWTDAAWEDTRGWLLYRLGRYDEAIASLTQASVMREDATLHAHLGLSWLAKGEEKSAFAHLVMGASGDIGEVELTETVMTELKALYPVWGSWHPGGLEGLLKAAAEQPEEEGREVELETHSLIGQALPFDSVDRVGGGDIDFSDVKTVTVIDLWATWCGPCVAGMPHLQEVAEHYADRGVEVYGLSVDGSVNEVNRFFKGFDKPAYTIGFLGRDGFKTMDVSGIPSLFVIGPDGKVAEYFSGYGGDGDNRLEEAIDRLLDAEDAGGAG